LLAVDLAAPGEHIVSAAPASSYQSRTGTSAAAPFVSASLALLSAARPDLSIAALRDVLMTTARRPGFLASLLAGGHLDVGAAMHRVLAGTAWKVRTPAPPPAVPVLRLRTKSVARAGRRVKLRWTATGADNVTSWRVSLDGRVLRRVPAPRAAISRRVTRGGRHQWRVVGFDDSAVKVIAGRTAFRIVTRR
jgi:subtilisin family serine protease